MSPYQPHIALADDVAAQRTTLSMVLHLAGYCVTACENGAQLLSVCQSTYVDIVITDLCMPNMSGDQAAKLIRQSIPHKPDLPIIFFSGVDGDSKVEEAAQTTGITHYIPKGEDPAKLLKAIDFVLKRSARQQWEFLEESPPPGSDTATQLGYLRCINQAREIYAKRRTSLQEKPEELLAYMRRLAELEGKTLLAFAQQEVSPTP